MTSVPETAPALRRRTIQLLCVLVPAIVLSTLLVFSAKRASLTSAVAREAIPAFLTDDRGVTWTSSDMELSELEMTILETRDYLMRTYADGRGTPVDLCIVFSEDNRKGTHPPDVCLEGGGSRIVSKHDRTIDVAGTALPVRELVVQMGERPVYFAYFYKCGDTFTPSFYWQQVVIIWNGLSRQNAAGALVRYSTPMGSVGDIAGARSRTDELVRATFPHIKAKLNAQ